MGVYLYCIGGADQPEPEGRSGVNQTPVRAAAVAGFRVWISDLASAPAASLDRIRDHNAVVEAASARVTPLPARFGQWFASLDDLAASIEPRRAALEAGLSRIGGAMEFGVRIRDRDAGEPSPPDRSSGKAYLEGLAHAKETASARTRKLHECAAELEAAVGSAAREQRTRDGGGGELAVAHLVDRHDTGTYRSRVRDFRESRPDLRIATSGPWPPYGFVEER